MRFYRAVSYYFRTAELIEDLLWRPTRLSNSGLEWSRALVFEDLSG